MYVMVADECTGGTTTTATIAREGDE